MDLLSKLGEDSSCRLGHFHTKAGKNLPKKLDTRATSLLYKIQFRQGRIPQRRATFTLQMIKVQKARMEGNLHSVTGETIHQRRPEGRNDKMHTSQTGGHLAQCRRQNAGDAKEEDSFDGLAADMRNPQIFI